MSSTESATVNYLNIFKGKVLCTFSGLLIIRYRYVLRLFQNSASFRVLLKSVQYKNYDNTDCDFGVYCIGLFFGTTGGG